jgi:alkylation response protein AidB-like acyl-CoA dehydrogenase
MAHAHLRQNPGFQDKRKMNQTHQSPLPEPDAKLIAQYAAASDQAGLLAPPLQSLVHERGWLRMLAPAATGGAELPLPQAVRLEESIAAVDGSTGWFVTLCAGAGWFAGFLPPQLARETIGVHSACIGGSGAVAGFADVESDGYRLGGHWPIATGAPLASHFTMNAVLREHGRELLDAAGKPRVRSFIVPAGEVRVHNTWRNLGMRASGSHAFSLDNVHVSAGHAFDIDPAKATAPGPLYRFPFASLAYTTIAANISGMARHFVQLAGELLERRMHPASGKRLSEHPEIAAALAHARHTLEGSRSCFYRRLDQAWDVICRGGELQEDQVHALHTVSLALVNSGRKAVDDLFPYCGLVAVNVDSEIGRVWRDLHTGTQHAMLLPLADQRPD